MLGFSIGTILAIFDLQVNPMLPTKFQVSWPFCSGEEAKIDFQGGPHGGHLRFLSGTILASFDLQVTPTLPTKFQINWSLGSMRCEKSHLGFPTGTVLAIFDLHVTPVLPIKFRVNLFNGSGGVVEM